MRLPLLRHIHPDLRGDVHHDLYFRRQVRRHLLRIHQKQVLLQVRGKEQVNFGSNEAINDSYNSCYYSLIIAALIITLELWAK